MHLCSISKWESRNVGKQMYSKQLNRCLCFLQTCQSLARNKFPLCHPPAAHMGMCWEEVAGRQLFTACLQGWVHGGHAQDCSLPPHPPPLSSCCVLRGAAIGLTSKHPLPRLCRDTQASAGLAWTQGGL